MLQGVVSSRFWWRPAGVFVLVLGYLLLHGILRGYFSPTLSTDDMIENVFVQELRLGYQVRQPPIYEWLLYAVQKVLGPTLWSFLILKYALVLCFALFLYGVARQAIPDEKLSALSVYSYVALYQIGFNLHEGVTHTAVLMAASSATIYCFLWVLKVRSVLSALCLGVALGVGMLSKHSYYIVPAALFLAALSVPYWRGQLRISLLVIAAVVAAILYSPYLYWVVSHDQALVGSALNVMRQGGEGSSQTGVLTGELRLFVSLIGFSLPFLPCVTLVFFRSLSVQSIKDDLSGQTQQVGALLLRVLLISLTLAFVGVVLSGAQYIKERHMHPVLLLLPVVVFFWISKCHYSARSVNVYCGFLLVLVAVVLGIRVSGFLAPDRTMCGGYCRHMKPYAAVAEELQARYPQAAQSTIVSLDEYTGGNLRASLTNARHVTWNFQPQSPPRQDCFLLWDMGDSDVLRDWNVVIRSSGFALSQFPTREHVLEQTQIGVRWPHLWKGDSFRKTTFGVAKIARDSKICS